MRLKAIPLLFLGVLSILAPELRAQAVSDSSDRFLTAYQLNTKAESLEASKDYVGALKLLKEALGILDDIAKKDPAWNPSIREFRTKRIVEVMGRLESKGATSPGAATSLPLPVQNNPPDSGTSGGLAESTDVLPVQNLISGLGATPPRSTPRAGKPSGDDPITQIQNAQRELKEKLAQAQGEASAAKEKAEELTRQLAKATKERGTLDQQLRVVTQRAETVEQALLDERKKKAADAEKVLMFQTQLTRAKKDVTRLTDERDALDEVRSQEKSLHTAVITRAAKATQASADYQKQLAEIETKHKAELAVVEKKVLKLEGENKNLKEQLVTVTNERDTYKGEVAKFQDDRKKFDKALADNALLMQKLSDAEKQIVQFKADNVQKDVLITDLKKEIAGVTKQLDEAKKESASYQTKMSQLQASLQTTSEKLAMADTAATKGTAERKKMNDENDLLRGIVLRQMKGQAARDQMSKLILDEMRKMEIKSNDLLTRVKYLGEPVVKLTPKEAQLFKKPQVEVGESEISLAAPKETADLIAPELPKSDVPAPAPVAVAATPAPLTPPPAAATPAKTAAVAKTTPTPAAIAKATPAPIATPAPVAVAATPKPSELAMLETNRVNRPTGLDTPPIITTPLDLGRSEPRTEPATGGNVIETGAGASTVPAELQPTAQAAKDHFDRGNYRDAEKLYEAILAKAPTNLYALSNLGVVRFREGKLQLAEAAFRKAIAIAPEDAFSRCTLGIIYYSQTRYDEAVNELTKSLAINPKYAAAHNFLGITASQKGWQEAAQKELETATQLDPNYADAHFNLAVVYATQQSASTEVRENARKFYKRATELGAEKDPALEALLK